MKTISATDLARNTGGILDQVAVRRETIIIERNRTVIAQLSPPQPTMSACEALADLDGDLTAAEADAWLKDSRGDFDEAVRDPWA
jgi:antitoxin (DNA-binding transcriptional repressor) of toxin-antitoxin stability system